jgi:hypothetical protein
MTIGQSVGRPPDTRSYEKWEGFVLPDRRVGLEFEFENVRNQILPDKSWAKMWEIHEERSIRNHGAEYVFTQPMFGGDAHRAITGLVAHAALSGWLPSRRTGIHVHLDVRDLTAVQLHGLCLMYALLEPAIYRWIGDDRDSNVFCLPWYKAETAIDQAAVVLRAAMSPEPARLTVASEAVGRYAGLNLNSIQEHGSVEFRQLRTTLDLTRVLDWVNICMSLLQASFRMPQCDGALLQMFCQHGARYCGRELMGDSFEKLDYPDIEEDTMLIGVPTANSLVLDGLAPYSFDAQTAPRGLNPGFARFMEAGAAPLAEAPEEIHFLPSELPSSLLMPQLRYGRRNVAPTRRVASPAGDITWPYTAARPAPLTEYERRDALRIAEMRVTPALQIIDDEGPEATDWASTFVSGEEPAE